MAIDSAAKRFSILDFDIPSQPGMGPPDGATSEGDRLAMLWLYSGIAAGAPVVITYRRRIQTVGARQHTNTVRSP